MQKTVKNIAWFCKAQLKAELQAPGTEVLYLNSEATTGKCWCTSQDCAQQSCNLQKSDILYKIFHKSTYRSWMYHIKVLSGLTAIMKAIYNTDFQFYFNNISMLGTRREVKCAPSLASASCKSNHSCQWCLYYKRASRYMFNLNIRSKYVININTNHFILSM